MSIITLRVPAFLEMIVWLNDNVSPVLPRPKNKTFIPDAIGEDWTLIATNTIVQYIVEVHLPNEFASAFCLRFA